MLIDSYYSFSEFLDDFDKSFSKELGTLKTENIAEKIIQSKTINGLGDEAIKNNIVPHGKTIIEAVMSTRHFIFSKNQVVLYASIIALCKVLNSCALQEITFSDETMLQAAKQIFLEMRQMS